MDLRSTGKILYVASVDLSLPNGPGVNEQEFLKALFKALPGRVHAVIPTPSEPVEGLDLNAVTFSRALGRGLKGFLQHQVDQAREAVALLKQERFDLLVMRIRGLHAASLVWMTRHTDLPYAIKTLGHSALATPRQSSRGRAVIQPMLNALKMALIKDLVSHALAVDVCTDILSDQLKGHFSIDPCKLRVIDNAVNTDAFSPTDKIAARQACGLERFDPIVGYVGGRPWERGGAQLLEVAPHLLRKFPHLGVVIVGNGQSMEKLKQRAAELGVIQHCVFPGVVPYARVPAYINAFDVGVAFDTLERITAVGNANQKIRQYIACGKPVVATPGGNEFLEQHSFGSLVHPDNLSQIEATTIRWLSLTPEQRKVHEEKACTFARNHLSVDRALQERLEFWNERFSGG